MNDSLVPEPALPGRERVAVIRTMENPVISIFFPFPSIYSARPSRILFRDQRLGQIAPIIFHLFNGRGPLTGRRLMDCTAERSIIREFSTGSRGSRRNPAAPLPSRASRTTRESKIFLRGSAPPEAAISRERFMNRSRVIHETLPSDRRNPWRQGRKPASSGNPERFMNRSRTRFPNVGGRALWRWPQAIPENFCFRRPAHRAENWETGTKAPCHRHRKFPAQVGYPREYCRLSPKSSNVARS